MSQIPPPSSEGQNPNPPIIGGQVLTWDGPVSWGSPAENQDPKPALPSPPAQQAAPIESADYQFTQNPGDVVLFYVGNRPVYGPPPRLLSEEPPAPLEWPWYYHERPEEQQQKVLQEGDEEWLANYRAVLDSDPNIEADANRYATSIGLPVEVVKSDIDFAKNYVRTQNLAETRVRETNPRLFEVFKRADVMRVAHDDIEVLRQTEGTFAWLGRQTSAGFMQNIGSYYGLKQMMTLDGELSKEDKIQLSAIDEYVAAAMRDEGLVASSSRLLGQMAPSIALAAAVKASTALTAATRGATVGVTAAASAVVGAFNALMFAGEAYKQGRAAGLNHQDAFTAATTSSVVVGWLAGRTWKAATDEALPVLNKYFGPNVAKMLGGNVTQKQAVNLWKELGVSTVRNYAREFGEEMAETVVQHSAIQLMKEGSMTDKDWSDFVADLQATAKEVGTGMVLLAPIAPTINAAIRLGEVDRAKNTKAAFDRLSEQQAKLNVPKRDPGVSVDIGNALAQEANVEISPQQFREVVAEIEKQTLEKMAKERNQSVESIRASMGADSSQISLLEKKLPGISARLEEASNNNTPLLIKAGEWTTHFLNTPLGDAMMMHAKMEGQTMSLKEALLVEQLSQQWMEEGQRLSAETRADNTETARQARQVQEAFRQQMMAMGLSPDVARANATLMKHFVVAQSIRVGKKPVEFMRSPEFSLAIEAAGLGRVTPRVEEPGAAPFGAQPVTEVDVTQPLATVDEAAFGGVAGTKVTIDKLTDANMVSQVLGNVKREITNTLKDAKKTDKLDPQLTTKIDALKADAQKLATRLTQLQQQTPGQKAIVSEPSAEQLRAKTDVEALEKKLKDMEASAPPEPISEAKAFPEGRDKATKKEQQAYDRTVREYQKHQKAMKSKRGELSAAKAAVAAAEVNLQEAVQQAQAITPPPVAGRDISTEIQQAKQQLAAMKKADAPEADIKAQADWIKQAEQYERQLAVSRRMAPSGETLTQDGVDPNADPETQLEQQDLQKLQQILYHGTPWIWEPEPGYPFGRPRLDKLGTGEGALVYGWGFYTSAVENVGIHYRAQEYRIVERVTFDGKPVKERFDDVTEGDIALAFDQGLQEIELRKQGHPWSVVDDGFSPVDLANLERANWKQIVKLANQYRGRDRDATEAEEQNLFNALYKAVGIRGGWWNNGLHSFFHLNKIIIKTDEERQLFYSKTADALAEWIASVNNRLELSRKNIDSLTIDDLRDANNDVMRYKSSWDHRIRRALTWYIPNHRKLAGKLGWDFMKKLGGVPLSEVPEWLRDDWAKYGDKIQLPLGMLYKWEVSDFPFIDWSSSLEDQPEVIRAFRANVSDALYNIVESLLAAQGYTGATLYNALLKAASMELLDGQRSVEVERISEASKEIVTAFNADLKKRLKDQFPKQSEYELQMIQGQIGLDAESETGEEYDVRFAHDLISAVIRNAWDPNEIDSDSVAFQAMVLLTDNARNALYGFISENEIEAVLNRDDILKSIASKKFNKKVQTIADNTLSIALKSPEVTDNKEKSWANKKLVSELFLKMGFSGMRYEVGLLGGGFGKVGSGDFNFVIWDQKVLDSMAMISRNEELMADFRKAYEATIAGEVRGEFDPATGTILLRKHDASTMTHELAHWMLTVLERMSTDPNADPSIKANLESLVKWLGIKDGADGRPALDIWLSSTLEQKREGHEAFAMSFEAVMLGGEAPTAALRPLYEQMRLIMGRAYESYKDINDAYNRRFGKDLPGMTREVVEFMGRMLDADNQMMEGELSSGLSPYYATKEQWLKDGHDEEGWQEYQKALAEARSEAAIELTQMSEKAMAYLVRAEAKLLREKQKDYDAEYEKTRAEVEAEFRTRREFRLISFLRKGVLIDADGKEQSLPPTAIHKLDRDKVVAVMARQNASQVANWMRALVASGFDTTKIDRYIRRGGLDPKDVANDFGFQTVPEMLNALKSIESFEVSVEEETARRMQAKDGFVDIKNAELKDIAPIVAKALHGKARMKFVAIELKALIKSQQPVNLMNNAADLAASKTLAATKVKDVKPGRTKAEARHSRTMTTTHLMRGESEEAAESARNELLKTHLHQQQLDFMELMKKKLEKVKNWLRKDEDLYRTRDMDIVNAARAILAHYGLYTPKDPSKTPDLLLSELQSSNPHVYAMILPMVRKATEFYLARRSPTAGKMAMPINELTVDEFRMLMSQIDGMWRAAAEAKMAYRDKQRITQEAAEAEIVEQTTKHKLPSPPKGSLKWYERLMQSANDTVFKTTARLEHVFKHLDLGGVGAFTRLFWRPMNDASVRYQDEVFKASEELSNIFRRIVHSPGTITDARLLAPGTTEPYEFGRSTGSYKSELIMLLCNTGNASNKKYLLQGYGWSEEDFDNFIDRMFAEGKLTDADLDIVQQIFDLTEKIGSMANDSHHQMYGYRVDMLPPTEITNKSTGKKIKGGYVPIVPKQFSSPYQLELKSMLDDGATSVINMIPSVQSNFLKERQEKTFPELNLNISSLGMHVEHVVRYATMQPAVRSVTKLLLRPKIKAVLEAYDPMIIDKLFTPWLKRAASQSIKNDNHSPLVNGAIYKSIRYGGTVRAMATNVAAALQNFGGLAIAAREVGAAALVKSLYRIITSPVKSKKRIYKDSDKIRQDARDGMFDIAEYLRSEGREGVISKVDSVTRQTTTVVQKLTQMPIDMAVWDAMYNKTMEELESTMGYEEAHEEAKQRADSLVRRTQNANRPIDRAQSETGSDAYLMMQGLTGWYTNIVNYNRFEAATILKKELGWTGKTTKLLKLHILAAIVPLIGGQLVANWWYNREEEDDDGDGSIFVESLMSMMNMVGRAVTAPIPGIGQAYSTVTNIFDDNRLNDKVPVSPGVDMLVNGIRRAKNSDEFFNLTSVEAWSDIVTILSGGRLPVNMVVDPISTIVDEQKETFPARVLQGK